LPSDKAARRPQDIIDNAQAIFTCTEGMDLTAFEDDRRTFDAVERWLERICEAPAKLGDLAPVLMPDQPWHKIRAFGNVLRHEYDVIREDMLFEAVTKDLTGLYAASVEALRQWNLGELP
jgi:uncharacterized protein with HEPN domain